MNLDNWTIRSKLIAGFGLVLVIACIVSLLGIANLSSMNDRSVEISRKSLPSVSAAGAISRNLSALRIARLGLILAAPIRQCPRRSRVGEREHGTEQVRGRGRPPVHQRRGEQDLSGTAHPGGGITARRCRSS